MSALVREPLLELRDLRLVLALIQAGTTSKAAELLHRSQPAVSRALLSIEERLDVPLFSREGRRLIPNDAALHLAKRAQPMLADMAELERELRTARETPAELRIVCECYTAYHWLPAVAAQLRQASENIDLRLCLQHTDAPREALREGQVDVAMLTSPLSPEPGLQSRAFLQDELFFVLSKTHPLASKPFLSAEDVANTPLYSHRVPRGEAQWFMRTIFGRKRPRLNATVVPLTEVIIEFLRLGEGMAIISGWVLEPYLGTSEFVKKRWEGGPLMRPWQFAWRKELGELGPRLQEALGAALG